ncbi:hypothetical protein [Desulforamulus aeronauticus]|uniref:t-SNARE coiled-coil homology domain-containing protein n=1 Tax=Desulforamulus aeronauticus DSM 10349 TaxID=1121421 RepID=A0A1M6WFN2_9FIRM|nr:hypothetical protein [Desulforamulus aeronauticus]SHK92481.1 hypothetical protein SAMN02745123_03606 [Desulforamulus aeronauticus DSM 10349]
MNGPPPPYLATVNTETAGLRPGDNVKVVFYASDNTTLLSEVTTTGGNITAPGNAFFAYIKLTTGSSTGVRYAWFNSGTNTNNYTVFLDKPNTSDAGGGIDPGPDPEPEPGDTEIKLLKRIISNQYDAVYAMTTNFSKVTRNQEHTLTALDNIDTRLSNVINRLDTANNRLSNVIDRLDTVNSNLSNVINRLDTANNRLSNVIDRLDTSNSHLNVIQGDLGQLKGYITTPRSVEPIGVTGLNRPTFDATLPPLNDPPQQPYNYNRPEKDLPSFIDSPSPLPINPDPTIMPHDPATIRDNPLDKDPVYKDAPKQKEPVIKDDPATRDPVIKDNPLNKDPVIKDRPIIRDPVIRDNPITRDEPINRDNPIARDTPLRPDPPLTPTPPI